MIPLKVVTVHDEHPDLSRRELGNMTRHAHAAIGRLWASQMLPEHFLPGAAAKFQYAPRSGRWIAFKRRMMALGRADPNALNDLVFSGQLRDDLLRSARNLVRAFPSRVTISLIGPDKYFTLRPRKGNTARIAREVTAVSSSQVRQLGETFDRAFNAKLSQLRRSRRLQKVTKS